MPPIWVIDTSSLIQIKSDVSTDDRDRVFEALTKLAAAARLLFPREVIAELKRDTSDKRRPDAPTVWAIAVEAHACRILPGMDDVKAVLLKDRISSIPQKNRASTKPTRTCSRLLSNFVRTATTHAL